MARIKVSLEEGLLQLRDKLLVPPINMGDAPYVMLDFHIDDDEWRVVVEWYGDRKQFQASGPNPTAAVRNALKQLEEMKEEQTP